MQKTEGVSATEPMTFLRRKKVEQITGLSRSSIYDLVQRGKFPRPIPIMGLNGAVAWRSDQIAEWQRQCIEAAARRRAAR